MFPLKNTSDLSIPVNQSLPNVSEHMQCVRDNMTALFLTISSVIMDLISTGSNFRLQVLLCGLSHQLPSIRVGFRHLLLQGGHDVD